MLFVSMSVHAQNAQPDPQSDALDAAETTEDELSSSGSEGDLETINDVTEMPIEESSVEETPIETPIETPASEPAKLTNSDELMYAPDVEVEKSVYMNELTKKDCNCGATYMMPYRERRTNFGFTLALGYSQYTPTNYKPDFVVNETYDSYYGYTETPLVDVTFGLKWNNPLGSLAVELGGGYYFNNSKNEDDNANLRVMPVRAGATLAFDTIFAEPYIVPYGTIGAYSTFYQENLASQVVKGNTPISMYYAGGALFQLNSLDEDAAIASFDNTGLENTFVYAEVRGFVASTDIPNFGTDPQFGAGIKFEY